MTKLFNLLCGGPLLYFPQVAAGDGYTTTFTIINVTSGSLANVKLLHFRSDGSDRILSSSGFLSNDYTLSISNGGSASITASNEIGGPVSGWGMLSADTILQGVATFDLRDANGKLLTTAGVMGGPAVTQVAIPVVTSATTDTGVAIANVALTPVSVRLRLFDEGGTQVASILNSSLNPLSGRAQVAAFVTQLFPSVPGIGKFHGKLVAEVEGSGEFSATALTMKEGLFSALPVVVLK